MDVLFGDVEDADRWVYHYTDAIAVKKILSTARLRLGPYIETHDPREAQDWFFSLRVPESLRDGPGDVIAEALRGINGELNKLLKYQCKVACFCADLPSEPEHYRLHRGYAHPRMWDQYADHHRGACLVFDSRQLRERIREQLGATHEIYHGRVHYGYPDREESRAFEIDYGDVRRDGIDEYARRHLEAHQQSAVLSKAP
jgi:Protein of unknown function (DUF2971)